MISSLKKNKWLNQTAEVCSKGQWKNPVVFLWKKQGDANFRISLKKYFITVVLYCSPVHHPVLHSPVHNVDRPISIETPERKKNLPPTGMEYEEEQ